jgi:hypothetical protein
VARLAEISPFGRQIFQSNFRNFKKEKIFAIFVPTIGYIGSFPYKFLVTLREPSQSRNTLNQEKDRSIQTDTIFENHVSIVHTYVCTYVHTWVRAHKDEKGTINRTQ